MMISKSKKILFLLGSSFALILALSGLIYEKFVPLQSHAEPSIGHVFVEHSGSGLLLASKAFRFSGANIYWLGLQETSKGISYPSHFEINDALATASLMGTTVVRSHTLGISVGCSLCVEPSLGVFRPSAWESIDYAIYSAHQHNIRLIIPFTDNWHYYHGGKHTFVDWRGLPQEEDFYSNVQVIADFEDYVGTFLNHINSYTRLAYKDDPTIMAWETGNELAAPMNWVQRISLFIKKNDPQHLIMDGNYEQANEITNFGPDLFIPSVDIYTGHYYPPTHTALLKASEQASSAQKVFIVGEYDWNTTEGTSLADFFSAIEQSNIAGDMYWSLFPHDDQHGFVSQSEHFTLHYPGYTSDVRERIRMIREHAYAMQKVVVPLGRPPGTPLITTPYGEDIVWRGADGADTYTIEFSTQGIKGPWVVVCNRCVTDFTFFWRAPHVLLGTIAAYRMRAYSVDGIPGPYSSVLILSGL